MYNMSSIEDLIKENNVLLKEIVSYIRSLQDTNNIAQDDAKDFFMSVVANLVANSLERDKNARI